MKRIEIICNNSIYEDFEDIFSDLQITAYTKIENVHGVGTEGEKWGDAVWPQENFILVIYCEDDRLASLRDSFRILKSNFPGEGLKMFVSDAEMIL
ncbi:MAG: hypothetical protein SOZ27_02340 [Spirochaetia bacterium]|nr:hypothetical protein [Spirochaetia bacterium]